MQTSKAVVNINGRDISLHQVVGTAARDVLAEMKRLSRDDHPRLRLPGPNPVSIERKDITKLKNNGYVISEKTDGTRYILMCLRLYGLKLCVIIDRAFNVYLFSLQHIPRVLFQGTIFDGELTVDKRGLTKFILFDAVVIGGVTVSHMRLDERVVAMKRSLNAYRIHPKDIAELNFKQWIVLNDPDVVKKLSDAEDTYNCDGYVLMNYTLPVKYGRDFDFFKLKPDGKHTVDFIVLDANGAIGVYDPKTNANVKISNIDMTKQIFLIGTIVECVFVDDAWVPLHVRTDKTQANDMLTYSKTLTNIKENIRLSDILSVM